MAAANAAVLLCSVGMAGAAATAADPVVGMAAVVATGVAVAVGAAGCAVAVVAANAVVGAVLAAGDAAGAATLTLDDAGGTDRMGEPTDKVLGASATAGAGTATVCNDTAAGVLLATAAGGMATCGVPPLPEGAGPDGFVPRCNTCDTVG